MLSIKSIYTDNSGFSIYLQRRKHQNTHMPRRDTCSVNQ